MHPGLLGRPPGKTIDISFSLRQDPLEQALFGELPERVTPNRFELYYGMLIFDLLNLRKCTGGYWNIGISGYRNLNIGISGYLNI